jgi:hypothetical protein
VRRLAALAALAALLGSAGAAAQSLDESGFRYVRPLDAPPGLATFEPDGPLFAHAKPGLGDVRIVDSEGRQVPWRFAPEEVAAPDQRPVTVLNAGRRGGAAVALLDLGPSPGIHDRVDLAIQGADFVGRVEVSGSDSRRGPFTRLSTTGIYDVGGAQPARSTTAVYPPSDFRYLSLRATGVEAIMGASIPIVSPAAPELVARDMEIDIAQNGRTTVVTADLGFRKMPVDEVALFSTTELYDRPVTIEGSNDGAAKALLAYARVFRFPDSVETAISVTAAHRYLYVTIDNGDDAPLQGLRLEARARSRAVYLADGFAPPYRLLYGNRELGAPSYDFAEAPSSSLDLDSATEATLGREALNPEFEPPEDTRSFVARHPELVTAALAVAAAVLGAGAFLALRRKA